MTSFAVLPNELVETVFLFVDIKTLLECRLTCRFFCTIIDSCSEITYRIQLEKAGLVDDPSVKMVAADRLNTLDAYTRAWDAMKPASVFEISLIKEPCSAYELVGGVFAKAMPNPAVSGSSFSRTLQFVKLHTAKQPSERWTHLDVGFDIRDFAIDPSVDLLVLLPHELSIYADGRLKIHLRTMTANEPHPLAANHILEHPFSGSLMGAEIQIADDLVSLQSSFRLLIWNWHTGALVVDLSFETLPVDFDFVTPRSFVIVHPKDHCLDVYSINEKSISPGRSSGSVEDKCVLRARLELPQPYDQACRLSIHTSPYIPNRPRTKTSDLLKASHTTKVPQMFSNPKPFQTDAENRIHVLTVEALGGLDIHENAMDEPEAYFVAIRNSTFEQFARLPITDSGPKILKYSEWAHESHWTRTDRLFPWLRYTHGSRFVLPALAAGYEGPQLRIIDIGARPPFSSASPGPDREKHLALENCLRQRAVPTTLTLPEAQYSGFMMDEDRILGFKTDDRHRLVAIMVLCFI